MRPENSSQPARRRWQWPVAVLFGVLAVIWTVQNEIVHASIQVGNAVPPIPALAAFLILGSLAYRWKRRPPETSFPLQAYLLVTMAAAIPGISSMSYLFAAISIPQYRGAEQSGMARIASHFPRWYAPPAGENIRRYFEGTPGGHIAWQDWAMPLAAWGSLIIALMLTIYALLVLLRPSWMESERLSYPMVQIPLTLMGNRNSPPLWRNGLMWVGFGVAAAYDGTNMLHAFFPEFPSLGGSFDIGSLFVDRPWSALAPFVASYRPEIFGIAYLMPKDVLLTTWVSYLGLRLLSVARVAHGDQISSTAYDYQEYGIGAFLCLFVILLWRARLDLKRSFHIALRGGKETNEEPLSARTAWGFLLLGTLFMVLWLVLAGLPLWLAVAHLSLLIAVAVVYARMRAETGAPMIYLFPFGQQQTLLLNVFGSEALSGGSERVLSLFASLGSLSRGYYPAVCAYSAEGMSLAGQAKFSQRYVTQAIVTGLLLGVVLGGYLNLRATFHHGAILLGRYQFEMMTQRYNAAIQLFSTPSHPKPDLVLQTLAGGGIVLLTIFLRHRLLWFPFHPMGFAMASAYGFHLWASFLIVWVLKTLILRFGGQAGYRRLMPFFLGVALGRYLWGGIIWGILGFFGHPATQSYQLQFS